MDLIDEEKIDLSEIEKIVEREKYLGYFITSAKTGQGVIEAFNAIIDELYAKYKGIPV